MTIVHLAGSLGLARVCTQGHSMIGSLSAASFDLKLHRSDKMADSRMQFKLLSKRPSDLRSAYNVVSGWSKLGQEANRRLLACFQGQQEVGARFFLTLGPMASFKFRLEEISPEGVMVMREKTKEILLAKPVRGPLISVDLTLPADGFINYTFTYTFSSSLFPSRN